MCIFVLDLQAQGPPINTDTPIMLGLEGRGVRTFAKYLLDQRDRKLETFRVASKVTIKLPSGDENKSPSLGSGSTDYAFSTVAGWIKNRIGLYRVTLISQLELHWIRMVTFMQQMRETTVFKNSNLLVESTPHWSEST